MCKWKNFAQESHRKRAGTLLRLRVVLCFHAVLFLLGLQPVLQSWLCNFHHIMESFDYYFTGYFFCAPFSKIENALMLGCMPLIQHFCLLCIWKCSHFYYYLQVPPLFNCSVQKLTQCRLSQRTTRLLSFSWKSVLCHFPCLKEP